MKMLLKGFFICSLVAQTHAFTDTLYDLLGVSDSERRCLNKGYYDTAIRSYLSLNQMVGEEFFFQGIWHGGIAGALLTSKLNRSQNSTECLQKLGVGVGTGLVGACITRVLLLACTKILLGTGYLNPTISDRAMRRAYWSGFLASATVSCAVMKLVQYVQRLLSSKPKAETNI